MQTGNLYACYRAQIEKLTEEPRARELWLTELRILAKRFDEDVGRLSKASGDRTRSDLCKQLDQEVMQTTNAFRRDVLLVATKLFDAPE